VFFQHCFSSRLYNNRMPTRHFGKLLPDSTFLPSCMRPSTVLLGSDREPWMAISGSFGSFPAEGTSNLNVGSLKLQPHYCMIGAGSLYRELEVPTYTTTTTTGVYSNFYSPCYLLDLAYYLKYLQSQTRTCCPRSEGDHPELRFGIVEGTVRLQVRIELKRCWSKLRERSCARRRTMSSCCRPCGARSARRSRVGSRTRIRRRF